ncbi:MAG TPA: phosphonate ABC transporter, permease protein PhnE [Usitatibacteraceae bacterium]|nr:phosphonate ABC transporter, permease protein PhnE [Usitatibacteraceae bacterium]
MSAQPGMAAAEREWKRFTPEQRFLRFGFFFFVVAAVVWSLKTIQVIPEFLYDAPEQVKDFFERMWPMDTAYYAKSVHAALIETLNIATLGTLLCMVFALPIGMMAARNLVPFWPLNVFAKFLLVATRSVNTLVWALLFIAIFGPGALAGTLAIAFRSIGFVGKLFGEALEEAQKGPIEALTATGAPKASVFIKGYWPQVMPAFWSIALFRWDINVRESAVLGLVGAGGIGMAMDAAMNLFRWDQVAVVLATVFVVVIIAEVVVTVIRKRLI